MCKESSVVDLILRWRTSGNTLLLGEKDLGFPREDTSIVLSIQSDQSWIIYTETTKADSVGCINIFIYLHMCIYNNQRKMGYQFQAERNM